MELSIIESALGRLANAMRIYGEAFSRYRNLVAIDKEEAIENLDRSFEASLGAFHSLYDVSKQIVRYFDYPDTFLIIALRNALHHRNHPLFNSLLPELWLNNDPKKLLGAAFLLGRHTMLRGAPSPMSHYVKLEDIYFRLDPRKGSAFVDSIPSRDKLLSRFLFLEEGLALENLWTKAKRDRYPDNQVYLDIMPIFISAIARAFTELETAGVQFKGFDANAYKKQFTSELQVSLTTFEYKLLRMSDLQIFFGPKLTINEAAIEAIR